MKPVLFLIFLANTCFAQEKKDIRLKAYYPFNARAIDESGNGNHPVFNNATLTADRFGNPNSAYHFNGVDNYMRVPNRPGLNFGNQITISAWVRPTGFYYGVCHASSILTKGGGNYMPGNYALRFDDALYTNGGGCDGGIVDSVHQNFRGTANGLQPYTPYVVKNQWYSVTYTNDGTTARMYVDCQLAYSVILAETFTNREDLFIGKLDDPIFPFWLNADLDEIRIYDKALDSAEIHALCDLPVRLETVQPAETVIKPVEPVKEIVLDKRSKDLIRVITVDHDSVSIALYDNGDIDGDSITLIYNNKILTTHQRLTDKAIRFTLKIDPLASNELVMYAENLGSIPPNTALMVIYDGDKRYELNVRSSNSSNGTVAFKLRE